MDFLDMKPLQTGRGRQPRRQGSIFLLALGAMTILFILGFSLSFITGSEDWSSSLSYEGEVAFNLAESAVEEFIARLKYALNHDDSNNGLYKRLRVAEVMKEDSEIPLDAQQVARLTTFTRETARQYGISFSQGMVASRDFVVEAKIKLKNINAVEAKSGNKPIYQIRKDLKEKQGELNVSATVWFRGRKAKVSLVFLLRVTKSFVPPFNYFTLYVKDGSTAQSDFNTWSSSVGDQPKCVALDHGWTTLPDKSDFDASKQYDWWERELAITGSKARVPPGRVYIGNDPSTPIQNQASIVQSTNGTKLLTDHPSDGPAKLTHINSQENLFLKFDLPFGNGAPLATNWIGLKDFVKEYMASMGRQKTKEGWIFTGWDNTFKVRIRNIGAGKELTDSDWEGVPAFSNALESYNRYFSYRKQKSGLPPDIARRTFTDADKSGLHLFGYAPPVGRPQTSGGVLDTKKLSPTLVYGAVFRKYFSILSLKLPNNEEIALPYLGTNPDENGPDALPVQSRDAELGATQAAMLFDMAGIKNPFKDRLLSAWPNLPGEMRKIKKFENFMSMSAMEFYNQGLVNFLNRMRDVKDGKYSGALENHVKAPLANDAYAGVPSDVSNIIAGSPMREFFEGDLWHAMPDDFSTYLMDFYFIPRSTEDFFRGRTTISVGGQAFDRFDFKYINDTRAYLGGAKNQVLELNGILALNDPDNLVLRSLMFRGHGIIYSSPMMGGGPVVISGDFFPANAATVEAAMVGIPINRDNSDMITIVAPEIYIDTDDAKADPCYVEANLISVKAPVKAVSRSRGKVKKVFIRGSVACPYMKIDESFPGGAQITYNPLNSIWRIDKPEIMDSMYVGKVVTGGVGKFDWKYEHE